MFKLITVRHHYGLTSDVNKLNVSSAQIAVSPTRESCSNDNSYEDCSFENGNSLFTYEMFFFFRSMPTKFESGQRFFCVVMNIYKYSVFNTKHLFDKGMDSSEINFWMNPFLSFHFWRESHKWSQWWSRWYQLSSISIVTQIASLKKWFVRCETFVVRRSVISRC